MANRQERLQKFLTPGLGIKRWIFVLAFGIGLLTLGLIFIALKGIATPNFIRRLDDVDWAWILGGTMIGLGCVLLSLVQLARNILAPFQKTETTDVLDRVYKHSQRKRGLHIVAIGGGTGLPVVLRSLKPHTQNITALVTVADDGGSSGHLRREMGVLPPGDLRNNLVALADNEKLMTKLFQYRFSGGDLEGHAFGNLFIAALEDVVRKDSTNEQSSLVEALLQAEKILNIQGRVLPSTLTDVQLAATIRRKEGRTITVKGESLIGQTEGKVEHLTLTPDPVTAYPPSVEAILAANLIVVGPGSLYTSILPNLLVREVADAVRASNATKIYVCNVATQPGETESYTVADHILSIEKHIGRGVFHVILANDTFPSENAGENTIYVQPTDSSHEVHQRYQIVYADLTDTERPWRHDPKKLADAILSISGVDSAGEN